MYIHILYIKTLYTLHKQYTCPFLTVFASKFLNAYILTIHCRGITVKTHGPGVLNEDQESEMQSIRKCTEENSLQVHHQKTVSILAMEFVGHSAYNS